jgi:hypothetical protein
MSVILISERRLDNEQHEQRRHGRRRHGTRGYLLKVPARKKRKGIEKSLVTRLKKHRHGKRERFGVSRGNKSL